MITAYLVGDRELIARLNSMPARTSSGLARAVTRLSLEGTRVSQRKLSGEVLKVRTGALRSGVHPMPISQTTTAVTGGWGSSVYYGKFHEQGVPHSWEIRPKSARVLAFEVGGQTIFARHVIHPPLPQRSFMASALRELTPQIKSELEATVKQEVSR